MIPVLIVHHGHDDCLSTPYEAAYSLKQSFVKSPKVDFVAVNGGSAGVGYYEGRGKRGRAGVEAAQIHVRHSHTTDSLASRSMSSM
jgi:hypothetical protein